MQAWAGGLFALRALKFREHGEPHRSLNWSEKQTNVHTIKQKAAGRAQGFIIQINI